MVTGAPSATPLYLLGVLTMSKRKQKLQVSCTWGQGPDVMVAHTYEGHDGCHHFRYIDLTIDEARALAAQLVARAGEAEMAEREAQAYFDKHNGEIPKGLFEEPRCFDDIAGGEL